MTKHKPLTAEEAGRVVGEVLSQSSRAWADVSRLVQNYTDLLASRERLTAECESLRAVVERLPKTADGVPVNSLDVLWQSHPEVKEPIMHREYIIDQVGAFVTFQKAQYLVSVHCYSTRAAAEAARLAGKESPDAR